MRASISLRASLLEQDHGLGVVVVDSGGTIEGTIVRNTLPQASDGLLGDGIVIVANSDPVSLIEANARVGVGVFGAHASLAATMLECNAIDLNHESFGGLTGTFDDLGDNRCGCGPEQTVCNAVSSGIEAPPMVGPID